MTPDASTAARYGQRSQVRCHGRLQRTPPETAAATATPAPDTTGDRGTVFQEAVIRPAEPIRPNTAKVNRNGTASHRRWLMGRSAVQNTAHSVMDAHQQHGAVCGRTGAPCAERRIGDVEWL